MSIETMKLALEALIVYACKAEHKRTHADNCQAEEAITALRQAIEQAQSVANQQLTTEQAQKQEPVAHWSDCAVHSEPAYPKGECDCGGYAPPQRQPLSDEEIAELWLDIQVNTPASGVHEDGLKPWRFARAIEAKLKGKNGL